MKFNIKQYQNKTKLRGYFKQRGLSLVELMISLGLSATLMAGVAQVFVTMRQTDRNQEEISRIQEAGRFALNFLSQDIRMAGYLGCTSTLDASAIDNTMSSTPSSFQPAMGIQGWEANGSDPNTIFNSVNNEALISISGTGGSSWTTSGGNSLDSTSVVTGTDIVRVWSASGDSTSASTEGQVISITPGASTVVNTTNMSVSSGDILILSDCQLANIIQACAATVTSGTLNVLLSSGCSPGNVSNATLSVTNGAKVVKLGGTMFYIGKRGNDADNPPALFRRTLGNNATFGTSEELVEGIEDMQILYGENADGDSQNVVDYYVPADQVSNWSNVVSIRVSLLVQSIGDNLVLSPQAYTFNGVTYDGNTGSGSLPPDGKLRRVFTTTINLRNRVLGR